MRLKYDWLYNQHNKQVVPRPALEKQLQPNTQDALKQEQASSHWPNMLDAPTPNKNDQISAVACVILLHVKLPCLPRRFAEAIEGSV